MASGLHRRASDVPPLSVIVEAWAQGLNVGALVFISLIVLCNYRRHITLHKLILLEVCTTLSFTCICPR